MDRFLSKKTIADILALPNVVGIGNGLKQVQGQSTGEAAIVVMVTTKVPISELTENDVIPTEIEGKISDVIQVGRVSAQITAANVAETYQPEEDLLSRQSRWRPAPGGVSVGHYQITAGTIGSVVYDKYRGYTLILSNNHVLANATNGTDSRARRGDPILQPGAYDGGTLSQDRLASLYRYVPLNDSGDNLVDAAVAMPINTNLVTPVTIGIGQVNGTILPRLGMTIKKSGRTTGLLYGSILAVDAVISVYYGEGRILAFKDQIITTNISAGGDSGSLVLNQDNWAVGLLFAGSSEVTVVNPIETVLRLLSIRF